MSKPFRLVSDNFRASHDQDGRLVWDLGGFAPRSAEDKIDHGKTSAYDRSVAFDRKPFHRLIFDPKHGVIFQNVQPLDPLRAYDLDKSGNRHPSGGSQAHRDLGHQLGRRKIFASLRHRLGRFLIRAGRSLSESPPAGKAARDD